MSRKLKLLSKEIADLLITQLAHELKNYTLYRSYANYFSVEGLTDLETYFLKRAEEEYNHHDWISMYLSEADEKFTYPAIEKNSEVFTDYVTPFKQTVEREILTTDMLKDIYKVATSKEDFLTASWLFEKLIKEQIEEENVSRMAVTIIEETSDIFLRAKKILQLLK